MSNTEDKTYCILREQGEYMDAVALNEDDNQIVLDRENDDEETYK